MKKLNNKGLTIIEVVLCFVLVSIITVSMYSVISTFNEKRIQEKIKEEIFAYRNLLTKDIEDDFIKIGLSSATITENSPSAGTKVYNLTCTLKDGSKRRLLISRRLNTTNYRDAVSSSETAAVDDSFSIRYGTVNQSGGDENVDVMEYPLPDFGYSVDNGHKSKLLSIGKVSIIVDENRVLRIYIGLYHPELDNRYSINVVSLINYDDTTDKTLPLGLY